MRTPGSQTVHVISRRYIGNGDYTDGDRTTYEGCSVQPMPAQEQTQFGMQVTRRWRLYGPPGLRAAARDELEVEGLHDEDRTKLLRLALQGPAETWVNRAGAEVVVEALLEVTEGSSR